MINQNSNKLVFFLLCLATLGIAVFAQFENRREAGLRSEGLKLYWFIPDGLRSEKEIFKIYEWARAGELPHLAELMKRGSYGYSRPVFPSHTPTNFATLMTGEYPNVHGVADGAMRHIGYPLSVVLKGGFSSSAKKVPSIWNQLEVKGDLVSLLSVPGSTPPDISQGVVIKGRWGGWGADLPGLMLHSKEDQELRKTMIGNKNVFGFGSELTRFLNAENAEGWSIQVSTFAKKLEINMTNWGQPLYALMIDSTDDKSTNYDRLILSKDKKNIFADLPLGAWTDWLPVEITWRIKDPQNKNIPQKNDIEMEMSAIKFSSQVRLKAIRLGNSKSFRLRMIYNNLNEYLTSPNSVAEDMTAKVGPMVDFVDNFPPQLIYFDEDKKTFLEEAQMSFDWHRKAVPYMIKNLNSNVVIHSIYSPNQMLTSRWWMPYLDPQSTKYKDISESEREARWQEVKSMYKNIDAILGEIMKNAPKDAYIVFSSDHGALPMDKEILLNNLFAKKNWLKYKFNSQTEDFEIDWENSKVVFLQMDSIYINPKGLGGVYQRAQGPEYESLRSEVISALNELSDPVNGQKVISRILKWEEAGELHLPYERVGDLVIANSATYSVIEDITSDHGVLRSSLKGGYKQAILNDNPGLLTPFLIAGPGIKKDHPLPEIINHVEQYHLLMELLGAQPNKKTDGGLKQEIYEQ